MKAISRVLQADICIIFPIYLKILLHECCASNAERCHLLAPSCLLHLDITRNL
jgi:hypothetical protein